MYDNGYFGSYIAEILGGFILTLAYFLQTTNNNAASSNPIMRILALTAGYIFASIVANGSTLNPFYVISAVLVCSFDKNCSAGDDWWLCLLSFGGAALAWVFHQFWFSKMKGLYEDRVKSD
jgi:glycerol uptake facilitator-like aquaporin